MRDDETGDFWPNFLHAAPKMFMTDFLNTTFSGCVDIGVNLMTRLLYLIDPDASIKGSQKAGSIVITKLSAIQTVALQRYANITTTARLKVARFLRARNRGIPMLACEKDVIKVQEAHKLQLILSRLSLTFQHLLKAKKGILKPNLLSTHTQIHMIYYLLFMYFIFNLTHPTANNIGRPLFTRV